MLVAPGGENDDAHDGRHDLRVSAHHALHVERQDRADAGHAEIAQKLEQDHEPDDGIL